MTRAAGAPGPAAAPLHAAAHGSGPRRAQDQVRRGRRRGEELPRGTAPALAYLVIQFWLYQFSGTGVFQTSFR